MNGEGGVGTGGSEPAEIWLAVETATRVGSVAVWRDGLALELTFDIQGTHSERLLPAIDYALRTTNTEPGEVSALVIGAGPGSFTGVRIACSVAKGWVMARQAELFAYSSLLVLAVASGAYGSVCPLFDARRGEVYGACYQIGEGAAEEELEPSAGPIDGLIDELRDRGLEPVFTGEGAHAYRSRIEQRVPEARLAPRHVSLPRASGLLWLRRVAPSLGRVEDSAGWEPEYVRDWRVQEEGSAS